MSNNFLTAEWRKLLMVNYVVDPKVLKPFVPYRTELDAFGGMYYLSLVGFMFQNTRLLGWKVPFHVNFEEVNLRLYVKHKHGDVWRRGVVFVKELVPKPALTFVANTIYKENYETVPMEHAWINGKDALLVTYRWRREKHWHSLQATAENVTRPIITGSEAEFITEHYWGYAKAGTQKTSEYEVVHPRWEMYHVTSHMVDVDFSKTYGAGFGFLNYQDPASVYLVEGSPITVKKGIFLT